MKFKTLIIIYLILLHFILLFMVFKTDFISKVENKLGILPKELTPLYHDMLAFHIRVDANLPKQTTIFIGDSITQGLAVAAVATPSSNYGIGNDTTYGVLQRIKHYKSLKTANAVVLAIGFNDLRRRSNADIIENYQQILQQIPKQTKLVVSAILPVDERVAITNNALAKKNMLAKNNARISEINSALKTLVTKRPHTIFVDTTEKLQDASLNLATKYHTGDGIHLSQQGYQVWIDELKKNMARH